MGLFSFVKEAGANLLGGKKRAAAKEKEAADLNSAKASELKSLIEKMDIGITDLRVSVDGEKAMVSGKTETQAAREKAILIAGNVEGIAEVEDTIAVLVPEPEAKFHTVVSGDSLSKIAKTYYGNAMKYPEIFEANKPMLTHPDKIYPGQVLRIPMK